MPRPEPTVTACIPYYAGKRYIRRAVEGLLAQTHRDLRVIVMNDGDKDLPWDQLASLQDPRLVRFSLTRNHGGPFFANAVVVRAISSPWFLVQEQDDWSDPRRVEYLLHLAKSCHADAALSAQVFHRENVDGSSTPVSVKWTHLGRCVCPICPPGSHCQQCFVDVELTDQYRHRAPHTALFRAELLRRIGGYYAGLHLHFDSLLMNLVMMTGSIVHTACPLYHRLLRPDSITHAPSTGFSSRASWAERKTIASLYESSFGEYKRYLRGQISSEGLTDSIRRRCQSQVATQEWQELAYETNRLSAHLDACQWRN
jgi:glycosyltransferase involved in cell wall biosynthesis